MQYAPICKIKSCILFWNIGMIQEIKARCLKLPGHYLCIPEPGRPDCVISIEIGVNGSVCQIYRTGGPTGQICDRSNLPHFQPDRNVRCCFQYYVYYVYSESDRYKFGPMKCFS